MLQEMKDITKSKQGLVNHKICEGRLDPLVPRESSCNSEKVVKILVPNKSISQ